MTKQTAQQVPDLRLACSQTARGRTPLRIQAARVAGVDIPNQKRIEFSLQYIYGVGHTTAKAILADTVSAASMSRSLLLGRGHGRAWRTSRLPAV